LDKIISKLINLVVPPRRWRIPVILLLGTIAGSGAYTIYVSRAWTYVSDNPESCINCHIMSPQYTTWRHSSHREQAVCNDCHVPHNTIFHAYYFKAKDGLRHSAIFTTRGYEQSIRMLEPGIRVVQENCIRCHEHLNDQVGTDVSHAEVLAGEGRVCWDCHREIPHGRVRSLSVTPFTQVPVPESPAPDWLKKLLEKKAGEPDENQ